MMKYILNFQYDKKYDFLLLNCGKAVDAFYRKCGFVQISSSAEYVRKNRSEIDDDPVLCFVLNRAIEIEDLRANCIFLGEDF